MRSIVFRAWDKKKKELHLVLNIDWLNRLVDLDKGLIERDFEDVVLDQYTGLKDKNDTDIYEGDIVSCFSNINEITDPGLADGTKPTYTQEFIWYDDGAFTKSYNGKEIHNGCGALNHSYNTMCKYLEVVGNIHENPELLEEISNE